MSRLLALRKDVLDANLELMRRGLAPFAFGNASGISRSEGIVIIKPSGVPYEKLTPAAMVATDLEGRVVEGSLRPSTDLPSHLALYRAFEAIGGIVHTHSPFATVWAQARRGIPCLGTTHADYFRGEIPVTEELRPDEIATDYERNTGLAIIRCLSGIDPLEMPAALVSGHGPFCWAESAPAAVHVAAVLEEVARMAYYARMINPDGGPIAQALIDKHFLRKHGPGAYYGQIAGNGH